MGQASAPFPSDFGAQEIFLMRIRMHKISNFENEIQIFFNFLHALHTRAVEVGFVFRKLRF